MHRLLVALLAALDALLAAAVGIAVVLAPLALMWVVALGDADWSALWPTAAAVWHLGHLVPITVTLPDAYLAATGVDPSLATFVLSLAPLAFAAFTGLFAARSGIRAAESGAALTGLLSGSLVFAAVAALVALTSAAPLVSFETWQAILFPSLIFAVPSLVGAVVGSWRVGDEGPVDRLRAAIERMPRDWAPVPGLVLRGVALTTLGLVAVGGVVVVAGLLARGTQIITLFQASNVDGIGATVLALGQLVYLPTLVLWAVAFAAGPGFSLGTDTAVTPAATQVGAVPGIPILGIVPESTTSWLLLLALLPLAVGALTGWILRSSMPERSDHEPAAPRLVVAVAVAALTGGVGALIAVFSSGAIGPGRLAETGPQPGPLALALGLEMLVGLAILLLAPRTSLPHRAHSDAAIPDREPETARAFRDRPSEAVLTAAVPAPWAPEPVPGDTDERPAALDTDDDVQARIREAWSRMEPLPAEWRDGPGTDATDGRDARPVD
ncbi:hypothetical protein CSIV_06245 [Microbacterium sp. CSI-V]|uniref:cell division protein PerM n=1 Tax=unclassified Microbacterium TaxID=2609290 RepID=UPI00097C1C2D|nr:MULTISPECIES: DUF6350 family protein [unclassified Microbacterium]ONI65856.1 hypothetical protein CSIV_06245 [Microbacterium sp. CSI-V]